MPLLGAHISISQGIDKAILRGSEIGCEVIQIFTRFRQTWKAKDLQSDEIDRFKSTLKDHRLNVVAIHGSYLINLASPERRKRYASISLLKREMDWADRLDIPYVVVHPGSHMGDGEERGIDRVVSSLDRLFSSNLSIKSMLLIETTAGQGNSLGYKFEHIGIILERCHYRDRLGVCLDTCHIYSAGYDFRNKEGYKRVIDEFEREIGLENLCLFHLNDSKAKLGSRIDRHTHIGEGNIGLKGFSNLLNDPLFSNHPFLIETPKGKDEDGIDYDRKNLIILRSLIGRERDDHL
ncbi:MAG TPA: deoxyribonuclease IV [Desulfobacteraceae bacterium]|nr:deoxyribonuclease IV [Desulfobacteraceae bacterium]